jgi:ABC-type lipoprotein release transport system permease subunit
MARRAAGFGVPSDSWTGRWLTILGITVGFAGSVCAASLIRSSLFGVTSWDVMTLAGVAAILGIAALLASFLPARRAASVNPVEALRAE